MILNSFQALHQIIRSVHESFPKGYNARKVISEVYASFVLQCAVTGR